MSSNVRQLTDHGVPVYPITDRSLVIGLHEGAFATYVMAWDGASTPVPANIPAGVVVNYNGTDYTGTLAASASTAQDLYLVASATQQDEYDRYITTHTGSTYAWNPLASTAIVSPVIADDLVTNDASKALSAKQGKVLGDKTSELEAKVNGKPAYFAELVIPITQGTGVSGSTLHDLSVILKADETYTIHFSGSAVSQAAFYIKDGNGNAVLGSWNGGNPASSASFSNTANEKTLKPEADVYKWAIYVSAAQAIGTGDITFTISKAKTEGIDDKVKSMEDSVINLSETSQYLSTKYNQLQILNEIHGRIIHHINVEAASPIIPSQSIYDIEYAKRLGFKAIEANAQKCSDGVFVTKHGLSGALGRGLSFASGSGITAETLFSDVSSTQLRQNVTYDSTLQKYCGHIPTLEEFCQAVSAINMTLLLRGTLEALSIARIYLPDERIIFDPTSSSVGRGNFKGLMALFDTTISPDDALEKCEQRGRPFYFAWSDIQVASDSLISNMAKTLHENGYALGSAYLTQNKYQELIRKGLDIVASTNLLIPPFYDGDEINIKRGDDERLIFVGADYDAINDVIQMETGETIKLEDDKVGNTLSKICVSIRYSGRLSVKFGAGDTYNSLLDWQSNGEDFVDVSVAIQKVGRKLVEIEATANTIIYDIAIFASILF